MNKFAIAALIATASAGFSVDGVTLEGAAKTSEETYEAGKEAAQKAYDDAVADEKNKANLEGCKKSAAYPAAPEWNADEKDGEDDAAKKAGAEKNAEALAKWTAGSAAATACVKGEAGSKTVLIVVVIAVAIAVGAGAFFMCKQKKDGEGEAQEEGGDDDLYFANDVEQSLN